MKRLLLTLCALIPLAGCTSYGLRLPQPRIVTNIPYHSTTLTIVNAAPDTVLNIIHDGRLVKNELELGQYFTINLWNWSGSYYGSYAQSTVTVVATDTSGKFVGTAARSVYVSGYERRSESWSVTLIELKSGSGFGWGY